MMGRTDESPDVSFIPSQTDIASPKFKKNKNKLVRSNGKTQT